MTRTQNRIRTTGKTDESNKSENNPESTKAVQQANAIALSIRQHGNRERQCNNTCLVWKSVKTGNLHVQQYIIQILFS